MWEKLSRQARDPDERRVVRARAARPRAGFSLLEIMIAISVLTLAVVGATGSILAGNRMQRVNRESAVAEDAVRQVLESMRGSVLATTFARFNATTADDPAGVVSPGATFAVEGLSAPPENPGAPVGTIVFPAVDVGGVWELHEDVVDAELGMPADLDGDGAIDGEDHSDDYRILPVRVQVQWSGVSGTRTLTVETVLWNR
jgi:prepilin-type N-terminal cleavage/methylation domain-containing protein